MAHVKGAEGERRREWGIPKKYTTQQADTLHQTYKRKIGKISRRGDCDVIQRAWH
jgi:hypothetical protein